MAAAKQIGDPCEPSKVNEVWARAIIVGNLEPAAAAEGAAPPALTFADFVRCVVDQRRNRGNGLSARASEAAASGQSGATAGAEAAAEGADSDSEDEAECGSEGGSEGGEKGPESGGGGGGGAAKTAVGPGEGDSWLYPVTVPDGAIEGTILTVPLPGNEVARTPKTCVSPSSF